MNIRLLVIVLFVFLLCGAGVLWILPKVEQRNLLVQHTADLDKYVVQIEGALDERAPSIRVFDRDSNELFVISASNRTQALTVVPEAIQKGITKKIDDIASFIVLNYASDVGVSVDDSNLVNALTAGLHQEFSDYDLIRFLVSTSKFGGYTGIVAASVGYFGRDTSELSEAEYNVLLDAFRNESFTIDSYSDTSITFIDKQYGNLRNLILEEMSDLGFDYTKQSYNISLSLSSQQQSIAQSTIDEGLKRFIDLTSNGSYEKDMGYLMVERTTGMIRSYIPGRTSKVKSNFTLQSDGFKENYTSLMQYLDSPDVFGISLIETTLPNGDTEFVSLEDLFYSMRLAEKNESTTHNLLDVADILFSHSEEYTGCQFINEIQTTDGTVVYTSPRESKLGFNNVNSYDFFSSSDDGMSIYGHIKLDHGGIFFTLNTSTFQLAICGSGLGGEIASDSLSVFQDVANSLFTAQSKFMPTPTDELWDVSLAEKAKALALQRNESYIASLLDAQVVALKGIVISSKDTRLEFENGYEVFLATLEKLKPYCTESLFNSYMQSVTDLRKERSALLSKYSV